MRALRFSLVLMTVVLTLAPGAAASATRIEPRDLGEWRAKGDVHDTVLQPGIRARAAQARFEQFEDQHGHILTLATDIPDVDLTPYAEVFAGMHHYDEIEQVGVTVVEPDETAGICGDPEALACYSPEDPARSYRGWIWIPREHYDLWHIMVHEYGHHVDNQLLNLGHLGFGCRFDNDGSRNWLFERDVDDRILDAGFSCDPNADWGYLLGELYAEDYTWVNGNRTWRPDMPTRAPAEWHLAALEDDFASPYQPRARRYRKWVRFNRSRWVSLNLRDWTFLTARLTGWRSADLDLYIFRGNARRAFARSRKSGSREQIQRILRPGHYDIQIYAYRDSGYGTLRVLRD